MAAPYTFTRRADGADQIIYAQHVNELQSAIEDVSANWLGLDTAPMPWRSGLWYSVQSLVPGIGHAGTQALVANEIYGTPLWVPKSIAIDRVGIAVQTGAGSLTRLMAHSPLADGMPGALLFDFGTVSTATSGDKELTVSATLPAGMLWLTCIPDGAITAYGYTATTWQFAGHSSQGGGNDYSPHRANGSQTAPDPFGTSSITWITGQFIRLAVRTA